MLVGRLPGKVFPVKIVVAKDGWDDGTMANLRARLVAGALVTFPTETFYGLGCDPCNPAAVTRLLRAKRRPADKPLPIIAANSAAARALVTLDDAASEVWDALTRQFWPGPLTLAAPAAAGLAAEVLAGGHDVAVRVSSCSTARTLAALCGGVIVATSANRSGEPAARTSGAVVRSLGAAVDLVVDGGPCPGGTPSTVVVVHRGHLRVVRPGAIGAAALHAAVRRRPNET